MQGSNPLPASGSYDTWQPRLIIRGTDLASRDVEAVIPALVVGLQHSSVTTRAHPHSKYSANGPAPPNDGEVATRLSHFGTDHFEK